MMCPDHQLLSVYLDGELPSPWKEKMESHLADCPDCAKRLENYRLVAGANAAQTEDLQGAKDRVWQKLAGLAEQQPAAQRQPRLMRRSIWGRRVAVPLPIAAAAAILFVVAATLVFTGRSNSVGRIPNMTFSSEEYSIPPAWFDGTTGFDTPGYPITDMNEVLQYLGSRDSGDILILRLPESRNFISSGEPAIIKAADYSRRKP